LQSKRKEAAAAAKRFRSLPFSRLMYSSFLPRLDSSSTNIFFFPLLLSPMSSSPSPIAVLRSFLLRLSTDIKEKHEIQIIPFSGEWVEGEEQKQRPEMKVKIFVASTASVASRLVAAPFLF